jgi:type 1 glutamine amidotransferase
MKKINWPSSVAVVLCALSAPQACADAGKIKVLIVDGQNNHQWATTTPLLKEILLGANRFSVDVSTSPPGPPKAPQLPKNATPEDKAKHVEALKAQKLADADRVAASSQLWAKWNPDFAAYDVVVSNYNGEQWPAEVRAKFVDFVKNGGGFVSYHAADNSFADWADYNEMIGLGGWGGRNQNSGPMLRLRDGAWTKVEGPGPCGGHGPQQEFLVETFAPEHPIMKGLPAKWMHTKDELYHSLRGPAKELTVLGHGLSDQTHEQEPLLMAISFGKGRVFHTTLGHYVEALDGLGFQVTFARGTEWAATGKVTQPAPQPGELTDTKAAVRPLKGKP